jgi:hypothetical protein
LALSLCVRATPSQVAMDRRARPSTPPQGKAESGDQSGVSTGRIGIVPIHPPTLALASPVLGAGIC